MTARRWTLGAGLWLSLSACATGTVAFAPGPGEHPAEASARVPVFRPAPDPLFGEAPLGPQPEQAMSEMDHGGTSMPGMDHGGKAPPKSDEVEHAMPGMDHGGHGKGQPKSGDGALASEPEKRAAGHQQHAGAPPAPAVAAEDRLVREYLTAVEALAKDDFPSAKSALEQARSAAETLSKAAQGPLAASASRVAEAMPTDPSSIEDVRRDLKPLSEALANLVRLSPPTRDAAPQLRKVYCPMAEASWLQIEAEVANPYFGSKMPRCGRVTETIESRAVPGGK